MAAKFLIPRLIRAILCLAAVAPAHAQLPERWNGVEVSDFEVEGEVSGEVRSEILAVLDERIAVVTRESLRTALAVAHSRLPAGDIEIRVEPREGGTAGLRLVVRPENHVASVEIVGLPDDSAGWSDRVLVRQGERLVENRLLRSVYSLEEALEEAGYLNASVRLRVREVAPFASSVTFTVDPGELHTVRSITYEPMLPDAVEDLDRRIKNRVGKNFLPRQLAEDTETIRVALLAAGYRQARVLDPQFQVENSQVDISHKLELGPQVSVDFEGFAIKSLMRRDGIPILRDQGFDLALIPSTERALRDYMQGKGLYRASVETKIEESADEISVVFQLTPGDKHRLREVRFEGAEAFAEERLRTLVLSQKGRPLVDTELTEDADNVRSFYVRQGFHQAQVEASVEDRMTGELAAVIEVTEGPRTTIGTVQFRGLTEGFGSELTKGLPTEPNGPFHESVLRAGVAELERRYRQRGHRSVIVDGEASATADDNVVDVEYQVLEGPQVHVGEVFLRGLQRTEPGFLRKVLDLDSSDVLSSNRMLIAERRLFQLGLFSEVDVRVLPAAPFSASEDIVVEVEEAPIHRITYGVGWDSEDGLRGLVGYVRNNWLGRALSWNLDASISDKEQLYRVLLTQPWIGRHRTPLTYSVFLLDEDRESFQLTRTGAQIAARQQRGRTLTGLLLTWRRNETSDELFTLDRELAPVEIASVTPSLFVDRRDDALDPGRGWSGLVQIEQAFAILSAEERFTKLFSQFTRYLDLGKAGTLAGSLRAGWINPSETKEIDSFLPDLGLIPSGLESAEVHVAERFVSGGRSSHRAYGRLELGDLGETLILCEQLPSNGRDCDPGDILAVGGNALALANLDWRFPISGALGGVAFIDAGNVWADWSRYDSSDIKLGAGVGIRYASPVGPLRLEIGWKLDREPFEDSYVVFFSLGNPF